MVPEAVLDSDILSEILKRRDPVVIQRATAYALDHGVLTFTSVTAMEILRGLHLKAAHAQIMRAETIFARNREIVPGAQDYRLAAEIMGALTRRGTPIGIADPLIAACALNRNLPLATGNLRHFGFVRDSGYTLRLEDWRAP